MGTRAVARQPARLAYTGAAIAFIFVMCLSPLESSGSVLRATPSQLALVGALESPASFIGKVASTDCLLLNNSSINKWVTSVYNYSVNSSSNPNTPSEATAEANIALGWAYVCPLPEFVALLKEWSPTNFSFQLAVNGATGTGIGKFLEIWYNASEDLDYQEYWNVNIGNGQVCGPYVSMWGPPPIVHSQVLSITVGLGASSPSCTNVSAVGASASNHISPGMVLLLGLVIGVGAGSASMAAMSRRAKVG